MGYASRRTDAQKDAEFARSQAALEAVTDRQQIRELLRHCPNEEAFQKMLDEGDPAMRDDLEALMRPMLPWTASPAPVADVEPVDESEAEIASPPVGTDPLVSDRHYNPPTPATPACVTTEPAPPTSDSPFDPRVIPAGIAQGYTTGPVIELTDADADLTQRAPVAFEALATVARRPVSLSAPIAPVAHKRIHISESKLAYAGLCRALLEGFQAHRWLHIEIVQKGQFEFILHAARTDVFGIPTSDYAWIWQELAASCPAPDSSLPDGTILDQYGNIQRPTAEDLPLIREVTRGRVKAYSK